MAIDIETVIDNFQAIYDRALAQFDYANANRAMENLAKYLGMFVDRQRIESANINYTFTNPQQLDREMNRLIELVRMDDSSEQTGTVEAAPAEAQL